MSIGTIRLLRVLAVVTALGWLGVGYTSRNVYLLGVLSNDAWILASGLAAGAALALARWGSLFALQSYTIITVAIGALRSVSYATRDVWGPTWIWLVLVTTTIAVYAVCAPMIEGRGEIS